MKIPITRYGLPQVLIYPAMLVVLIIVSALFAALPAEGSLLARISPLLWIFVIILFILLAWILSFFRDPNRKIPPQPCLLLSPADGLVSDITELSAEKSPLKVPTLRIGIFLSIFNVHINRTPAKVRIDRVIYQHGKFKNALDPESARQNESNYIYMTRIDEPKDHLLVRQISGAIARRIVCEAKPGNIYSGGQRFGMIKFGSRTELYLPTSDKVKCCVKKGDKVKAGLTICVRYE